MKYETLKDHKNQKYIKYQSCGLKNQSKMYQESELTF